MCGINGILGKRNSPALQNLNWNTSFMHDGGILNLEVQPLGPIANSIEQNENIGNVINKLNSTTKYKTLCNAAYGDEVMTSQRLLKSLAQFMGTMYSFNSKYDDVKKGAKTFSIDEQNGYNVFVAKCATCHTEPLFTNHEFKNNGIGVSLLNDSGRAHVTNLVSDLYKFKTPSLRNIEKSAPYMHDGRFNTLEDCLNHYSSSIASFPTLDPLLIGGFSLTAQNKKDIISFLKTLTDPTFLNDKRFAE
jgi:cytochrome c peroxidase